MRPCYAALGRRPLGFLEAFVACLVLLQITPLATSARAAGDLIEEKSSLYNNIYVYRSGPLVSLTFGHNRRFYTESVYDTRDELVLPVAYTRMMTAGLAYAAETRNLLEIGFGGGRTAWYLHKHMPQLDITCVELDPAVVEMAEKYFAIQPGERFKIEVADGRNYLTRAKGPYDVIMVDAYRGPFVPFHLLTQEFFQLVKRKLAPGGVAVQNIEPTTMVFDSAIATIRSVFENVDVYEAEGNVVAVAYDGPMHPQGDLLARARTLQADYKFRYPLDELVANRRLVNRDLTEKLLSDDFAPVESLLAIEKHNRKLEDFSMRPAAP